MPGLLRLVPLALVALSLWLWPNDASAQTVTINQTAIDVSGEERADETRLWIGRQDCLDNDTFTIPITTTGTAGYILEIWVGAGIACNDADNRDDIGQRCFRIGTAQPQEPAQELQVRAQDIVAAVYPSDGDNVCDVSSATDVAQQFSLYVMLMTGTGFLASDSAYATWESRVDLIGPSPPPGVRAGAGEEMLVVSWTRSSQVDIAGYRLYCDPSPRGSMDAGTSSRLMAAPSGGFGGLATGGSGGLTDTGGAGGLIGTGGTFGGAAGVGTGGVPGIGGSGVTAGAGGTLGDAGSAGAVGPGPGPSGDAGSGATSSGQSCSASSVLTPGAVPTTALEGHRCGSASSGIADNADATGLTNGILYTVAVAAVDRMGNVGPLSSLGCAVPKEVTDFFEAYREAGGEGGGGFCSAGGAAQPALSLLFGGGLLTYIWRRRRRAA